jgi:hypothetical protein
MKGTLDFSLLEWKHNEEKVAEEYCWVITQAVGRSCCGRLCSCVLEVGFHFDCRAYTDICIHMCTQFRLAQNSTCAGTSGV